MTTIDNKKAIILKQYSKFDYYDIPAHETSDPELGNTKPLVSILMITYNHENYIVDAITGVINQLTSFQFELLIGEDCSTDRTRAIALEYQKKYPNIIRVITSDANLGFQKNLLRLELMARGEYIAYCEGDDYWHDPNKLSSSIHLMQIEPSIGLVCSDINLIDEAGHMINESYYSKMIANGKYTDKITSDHNERINDVIHQRYPIATCTVCVRKEAIRNNLINDDILYCSDAFSIGDFQRWAEIAFNYNIAYINKPMSSYRKLTESATNSKNIDKIRSLHISTANLKYYLAVKYKLFEADVDYFKQRLISEIVSYAFIKNDISILQLTNDLGKPTSIFDNIQYYSLYNRFIYFLVNLIINIKNKM